MLSGYNYFGCPQQQTDALLLLHNGHAGYKALDVAAKHAQHERGHAHAHGSLQVMRMPMAVFRSCACPWQSSGHAHAHGSLQVMRMPMAVFRSCACPWQS